CVVPAVLIPPPHSTTKPGFPVSMNTNNPGVRKAARFGVYQYNNSSNDLFLFKELQINKAMVQIVRGLKYMLQVEIGRTVCEKREHSSLDSCKFQRKKKLQQVLRCYFEVWMMPWLHQVQVPIALCH
ncbi:Cystatin-F, partial [Struthio camelus australis]